MAYLNDVSAADGSVSTVRTTSDTSCMG